MSYGYNVVKTQLLAIEQRLPDVPFGRSNVKSDSYKPLHDYELVVPESAKQGHHAEYLSKGRDAIKIDEVAKALEIRTVDWDMQHYKYNTEADVAAAANATFLMPVHTAFAAYLAKEAETEEAKTEEAKTEEAKTKKAKSKKAKSKKAETKKAETKKVENEKDKAKKDDNEKDGAEKDDNKNDGAEKSKAPAILQRLGFEVHNTDAARRRTAVDMMYLRVGVSHPDGSSGQNVENGKERKTAFAIVDWKRNGRMNINNIADIGPTPTRSVLKNEIGNFMHQAVKYCKAHASKRYYLWDGSLLWLFYFADAHLEINKATQTMKNRPYTVVLGNCPTIIPMDMSNEEHRKDISLVWLGFLIAGWEDKWEISKPPDPVAGTSSVQDPAPVEPPEVGQNVETTQPPRPGLRSAGNSTNTSRASSANPTQHPGTAVPSADRYNLRPNRTSEDTSSSRREGSVRNNDPSAELPIHSGPPENPPKPSKTRGSKGFPPRRS